MSKLNEELIGSYAEQVFGHLNSTMITAMTHIGDRLGLYRGMHGAGEMTSEALAKKLSYSERWVREWLHGQAAIGYVDYCGDGRFLLKDEAAAVLADESNPAFAVGGLGMLPPLLGGVVPEMRNVFESGIGLTYDAFGPDFASSQERFWGPWFRNALVSSVLPSLDGVVPKLEQGALVADIGCGAAIGLIEMAKAYPRSEFRGFDNSANALARAESARADAGVTNVTFFNPDDDPLSEHPEYDFVTTFDCIHDMAHPTPAIRAIRNSLRDDGTWFVADIHAGDSLEENLAQENPMLPMLYGFSILCCLQSSTSAPDAEGLGTVGFGAAQARRMTAEAGFTRFRRTPDDPNNPLNAFYEIRP